MSPVRRLRVAEGLSLPIDAVTEPIGIFSNRGKGKSNAAHRFVEQLYHAGLPSVVLDVKGDWFGIRSSANGKGPGLPFLIFGGSRADVPLEPGSGPHVARFLVEQRVPTIVDLSQFSKTQARRWVMEFAEELYRINTEPLMVVVDEADVLIPQRLAAELMRLLGAMEDIAKRGRQRGLGIVVISQRVADVNKSVTDLLETLFLLAISGVRTRKAVGEWIDDHADPEEAQAVVATLSSLEPGEGWVWSPGWLRLLRRVRFLRPDTYDSHATPRAGERRASMRTMADVDVSAVKETFSEAIERAKAEDPKELQRRIRELERQLQARPTEKVVETVEKVVEVPVLDEAVLKRLEKAVHAAQPLQDILGVLQVRLAEAPRWTTAHDRVSAKDVAVVRPRSTGRSANGPVAPRPVKRAAARTAPAPGPTNGSRPVTALGRVMLTALAMHGPLTKRQLGLHVGKSTGGGYFKNTLGALRSAGFVASDRAGGLNEITEAGLAALGDYEPLPTGPALVEFWCNDLGKLGGDILRTVLDAWPEFYDRQELAEAVGKDPDGGYFKNTVGRMRTLGLLDGLAPSAEMVEAAGI